MRPALLLSALVLATTFGGCFAGEESTEPAAADEGTPSPTSGGANATAGPAPANETLQLHITITNATKSAKVGEPIHVAWEITLDDNATRDDVTTFVRWGTSPVDEKAASPEAYPDEAGRAQNTTVPDEFATSFTASAEGKVYLRAFADDNGTLHFTAEAVVDVVKPVAPTIATVTIAGLSFAATYNANSVTIRLGDGVRWTNMDPGFAHTATAAAGAPAAFSASVSPGQTSQPVIFTKAGTYAYGCTIHTTMNGPLGGTVIVRA